MSMKEIENVNTTIANATLVSVYTNTWNTFQINQQQQACGSDKYRNAHTQDFAIELSGRRNHGPSTLRMFCRLKTCVYKSVRQRGQESVIIQSVLCEVAWKQKSCGCEQNSE